MPSDRFSFAVHIYDRPWVFIRQTRNDGIFLMPRACAVGCGALSVSSSASTSTCALIPELCAPAHWIVQTSNFYGALPQNKKMSVTSGKIISMK